MKYGIFLEKVIELEQFLNLHTNPTHEIFVEKESRDGYILDVELLKSMIRFIKNVSDVEGP